MDGAPGGSPEYASPSIVCCMCGDLGLSKELFRCKGCHFRSQHKYCSEVYPKAEAYSNCNWCLREARGELIAGEPMSDGGGSSSSSGDALIMASELQRRVSSMQLVSKGPFDTALAHKMQPDSSFAQLASKKVVMERDSHRAQLTQTDPKPLKKLRPAAEGMLPPSSLSEEKAEKSKMILAGSGRVIRQAFRGKVRRYKLLEEVSS